MQIHKWKIDHLREKTHESRSVRTIGVWNDRDFKKLLILNAEIAEFNKKTRKTDW